MQIWRHRMRRCKICIVEIEDLYLFSFKPTERSSTAEKRNTGTLLKKRLCTKKTQRNPPGLSSDFTTTKIVLMHHVQRGQGTIQYKENPVAICPNYATSVVKACSAYEDVRRCPVQNNVSSPTQHNFQ
ncbi:hypothetical protein AMECASPLE_030609 [Ameca splendens]|uniref:Uncharacterized protein n=1 Tax=Ameca splendens TaxID=208324 RepID=A0ABV0XV26_9TELE